MYGRSVSAFSPTVSRLLSRILLSLLMLPLAAVFYMLVLIWLMKVVFGYRNDEIAFGLTNAITAVFVSVYWILLWRGTVRWTARRVLLTVGAAGVALFVGVIVGIAAATLDDEFGWFVGGVVWILLWLTATVLIWRETSLERRNRVQSAGVDTLACPRCGYNMTGLRESTCPECGAAFTISELLACQPGRQQEEVE